MPCTLAWYYGIKGVKEEVDVLEAILEGYRVVDLSRFAAGPLCSQFLADMGAEVIRIESAMSIEPMRLTPENLERNPEKDPAYHHLNRGKLCIGLDYRYPEGQEVLKRLVRESDVVVENLRPGLLRGHGLDYESLRQVKTDLIMLSLPSAGFTGPLKDIVTYGSTLGGLVGVDSMSGYYGERVLGTQGWYCDWNSPGHAAFAVLGALYNRDRTGQGLHVEVSQWETNISVLGEAFMEYFMNGRVMGTQGNRHRLMAPHNNFPCKEHDTWVSICIETEEEWDAFCEAIGTPPWAAEERFADRVSRLKNQDALDRLIGQWSIKYTREEVTEILQGAGVAAVPVLDAAARFLHPHLQERQIFPEVELPSEDGILIVGGISYKLSETPSRVNRPGPLFAEHNEYVFGQLLGMTEEEVARLVAQGVIYTELREAQKAP